MNQQNTAPTLELDPTQQEALDRLNKSLNRVAKGIGTIKHIPVGVGRLRSYFNVFAFLGPRGAGKTTLIYEFYQRYGIGLPPIPSKEMECKAEPHLLFLPPLDCSAIPHAIRPGAAVLMHLLKTLEQRLDKGCEASDPARSKQLKILSKKIHDVVGLYSRSGERFQDLCLDLSSSADDYSDYISRGLRERLYLGESLASCLDEILEELRFDAVVVLLDDFDLIPAEAVRSWLEAFMDELHQLRMLFVVTADFYRLEYLSWDAAGQFDDKTGRALLGKIMAPQNRVMLDEWSQGQAQKHIKEVLCKILEACGDTVKPLQPFFLWLLPRWPRGLFNLRESLDRLCEEIDRKKGQLDLTESVQARWLKQLLSEFATSRREPLLARRLREVYPEAWARLLKFEQVDLSQEDWQEMVDAIRRRRKERYQEQESQALQDKAQMAPLQGLVPVPGREDLKMISPDTGGERQLAPIPIEWWHRDPRWQDPLRHDRLRILPLRDATEEDREIWVELLLNFGLVRSPGRRLRFLYQWHPVARRLAGCSFRISCSRHILRQFFEDNVGKLGSEPLAWLRIDESAGDRGQARGNSEEDRHSAGASAAQELVLEIGLAPMAEVLRQARDPISSDLLGRLLVNVSSLQESDQRNKDKPWEPGLLLPGDVASLILFTDALDKCPWKPLSTALGWQLVTHISLSTAFVRTSYVVALEADGTLDHAVLSKEQRKLIEICTQSDPTTLLRRHEDEILTLLAELFRDDLTDQLAERNGTLSKAAREYLTCPYYTSVVNLLEAQPEVVNMVDLRQDVKAAKDTGG